MRYHDLFEQTATPHVFAAAKAAFEKLSPDGQRAVESWETMNWTGGVLEKHILAQDQVAAEVEAAFAPVRALLPEYVTLYRGIVKNSSHDGWKKALLTSWTTDIRTAELFAGLRHGSKWKSLLYDEITDEEIDIAVAKYERSGYVRFRNRHFVRNKDHPQYYNIYDRNRQFVTDGDDLRDDLTTLQQDNRQSNAEKRDRAHVFEQEISRDQVVWITNRLNCKEFLVRLSV